MEEQLKLHISWKSEGISISSFSKILKSFDNLNNSLSEKRQDAIITEVKKGSIVLVLASLVMGALKTPEVFLLLRNISNKSFSKDLYSKKTLKIALDFITNCFESGISLSLLPTGSDAEILYIELSAMQGIKSFLEKELEK